MRKYFIGIIIFSIIYSSFSQQHSEQNLNYIAPKDPLVKEKLEDWGNRKFGLLMHWGLYAQWGIVESWSLCPEDEDWCRRSGPYKDDWYAYKKSYENLQYTFNPVQFNPKKWSLAAKKAGMKYVVFTTKHHDGFCMFDTKETDYKITKSPFKSNPKSNVTKYIFDAFRKDSFMIGAYFSKPDWHTPYYWWGRFPPKDRNSSYHPKKYPEIWNKFKEFTFNQIQELMTDYGKVDILWLDGGWVRPFSTIDTSVSWQKTIPFDQDIDMPKIAANSRKLQPGLIVVDRTVTGEFENYVTPEHQIPDGYLETPWETCLTMGESWGYTKNEHFKSARKIINLLTDIVSKNGNLLLGIGPSPEGEFHDTAYHRLAEIGAWMIVNQESIYGTKGDNSIGQQGKMVFTHKNNIVYAIYRSDEGEILPKQIEINNLRFNKIAKVKLLGTNQYLKYEVKTGKTVIFIPENLIKSNLNNLAWVIKIEN